ncbi:MAG: antitoxin VapB family protein [Halobacteriales archaeon]|nr:antitoxin VapB family protein [Halobacteriales archaeon]
MSKSVRLDDDVHARIKQRKRDGETMSEAIDRLTSEYSLLDFAAGGESDDTDQLRELLEEADEADTAMAREQLTEHENPAQPDV